MKTFEGFVVPTSTITNYNYPPDGCCLMCAEGNGASGSCVGVHCSDCILNSRYKEVYERYLNQESQKDMFPQPIHTLRKRKESFSLKP